MRKLIASFAATALLALGVVSTATAQQQADGLVVVQVEVGDVTLTDTVDVNAAVAAVVQACGVNLRLPAIAILGQAIAVDNSGRTRTVCDAAGQTVSIANN